MTGDFSFCQVLFIGRAESRWKEILGQVRNMGVLTVSDRENFASQGGMVGFYNDSGRIRLEINRTVAQGANLKISAKLMELARSVP